MVANSGQIIHQAQHMLILANMIDLTLFGSGFIPFAETLANQDYVLFSEVAHTIYSLVMFLLILSIH